jgi:2-octaprenyl-6-methoxyphenol hydroxylase
MRAMNANQSFDVIIVGGGLAGGLAAVALAHEGFSCALIDAADPSAMRTEAFDGRTTALAYACARVYRRLGLWDAVKSEAEPIRDILVSDGKLGRAGKPGAVSPFHLHFDSRELENGEPLGWIIENRHLRRAIYDAIAATKGISLFAPATRTQSTFDKGAAVVELADGRHLTAPLVIAADGRQSPLRGEAGIRINAWNYRQTGIVVSVAHEKPHHGVAQEFFLPSGPFAILPLTNNRSSLVWTERREAAAAYLALDDDAFLSAVRERFGPYLGELSLASPRWGYPLALHLAQSYVAPRLALIGDAAHAVHPIAGQGYNLGVKDIAALADVLRETRDVGLDIGSMAALEQYQRWRRFDSTILSFGMDALNRLFSNDIAPLRLARDVGMGAVNSVAPLRRLFMRQAGADLGRLPSMMAPL